MQSLPTLKADSLRLHRAFKSAVRQSDAHLANCPNVLQFFFSQLVATAVVRIAGIVPGAVADDPRCQTTQESGMLEQDAWSHPMSYLSGSGLEDGYVIAFGATATDGFSTLPKEGPRPIPVRVWTVQSIPSAGKTFRMEWETTNTS